jgi:hypothetical protein
VSQPPTPVASFGTAYAGSNPHGPDENIRIDDFLQSIKLVGHVLHKLAETKSKAGAESSISEDRRPTAPLPRLKPAEKKE